MGVDNLKSVTQSPESVALRNLRMPADYSSVDDNFASVDGEIADLDTFMPPIQVLIYEREQ